MKRLLACVSFIAVTSTAAVAAESPAAAKHPAGKPAPKNVIRVAPADEYFGKLKISVLGIRNTIKDVGLNLDVDPGRWTGLVNKADFAEDAMRDWERKYPQDTWLAKTIFALERMYAKVDSDDGRRRSLAAMNWLVHDFPTSYYGKLGRKEIAAHRVGHAVTASAPAVPPSAVGAGTAAAVVPAGAVPPAAVPAAIAPAATVPAAAASPVPTLSPAEAKTVIDVPPASSTASPAAVPAPLASPSLK